LEISKVLDSFRQKNNSMLCMLDSKTSIFIKLFPLLLFFQERKIKHFTIYFLFIVGLFSLSVPANSQTLTQAQKYLDHSDYKNAMENYSKLQEEAKKINNVSLIVQSQNGIASCYMDLGARYKALSLLKQNVQLLTQAKSTNYLLLAKTHQLLADNYNGLALYEDYLEQCHLFYSYYKKAYPDKEIFKAVYYAYLGRYYNIKFNIDKAYYYTSNALKIYHKNKKENYKDAYLFYNAHLFTTRNHRADLCQKYIDSLSFFLNQRFPYDNLKKARLFTSIASPYLDLAANNLYVIEKPNYEFGNWNANKCIALYSQGIDMYDRLSGFYHPEAAYQNELRGLMYFYKRNYKKALENYDEGIERLTLPKDLSQKNYSSNTNYLTDLLLMKAWCLDEMYAEDKNLNHLYEIDSTLLQAEKNWVRYSIEFFTNKEQFNTSIYIDPPYIYLVKNYYKLYQATGKSIYQDLFFEYSEKSKYYALLGAMYKEKKPIIKKEKSNNNYKTVKVTFEDLLLKTNNKILLNNPTEYYKKTFENQLDYYTKQQNQVAFQDKNQIITLDETQKNLKENEAIIIYNVVNNQYYFYPYLLLVTKNEKHIINLEVGKILSNSKPETELLTASLGNNAIGNYKKLAFEYYKRYFKPAEAYLPKSITHIQIIPNAVYGNFPFDMLLTQDTKSNDFRKLPYLGKRYNFSYALSASISKILSKNQSKSSSFSVFTPSFKNNLSELKYVKKASKSIVTDYNAQLIKETNASKAAFSNHLSNDKIIAILSHGKATTDADETKKGIYFSDGFLSMNEVYNLKSDCDFLLLGACETGVGLDLHKEGTINLARAFTSIGVKSMMLASWKIDEESSMKIMELFLKHLNQGDTKSEALQKAKLEFLATAGPRTANPIYWAGLNIVGNNDTILLEENNYYWWSFVLVFPVAGGFWYWRRRKVSDDRL